MSKKMVNWNDLSKLGLIERINREIMHPLGLAVSREPSTGASLGAAVAPDGVWEYHPDMESKILSPVELERQLAGLLCEEADNAGA